MKIQARRHLAKTISYRIISTGIGFAVMFIATGSIKIGTAFSVFELCFKPLIYYVHERFWWKHIKYGVKDTK